MYAKSSVHSVLHQINFFHENQYSNAYLNTKFISCTEELQTLHTLKKRPNKDKVHKSNKYTNQKKKMT